MLRRELNLISPGKERGKRGGSLHPAPRQAWMQAATFLPASGPVGWPYPGGVGWGGGCAGLRHAGCSRLQRDSEVQNVCGQPAQLPDALQGLELWLRKRALSSLHVHRQERPDFAVPPLPTLPARSSKFATSFPPSLSPLGSIHPLYTPWKGKLHARIQQKGNGCVRKGQPGSKTLGSRLGARERTDGVTPGDPGPRSPTSASSALPPLQWEMEQGHPGPPGSAPTPPRYFSRQGDRPVCRSRNGEVLLGFTTASSKTRSSVQTARPLLVQALHQPHPCPGYAKARALSTGDISLCSSKRLLRSPPVTVITDPVLPRALLSPAAALEDAPYSSRLLSPGAGPSSHPGIPAGPQHDRELLQLPSLLLLCLRPVPRTRAARGIAALLDAALHFPRLPVTHAQLKPFALMWGRAERGGDGFPPQLPAFLMSPVTD